MGLFASDWQRLHKKISRQYELIALRNLESGLSPEGADVLGIITEIVREYFPNLSGTEAEDVVRNEYKCFKDFSVRDSIACALRQMNPDIPEVGVSEIFEAVKSRFHAPEREHEYFLFFIISKIIELGNLSISRGSYLIDISRGRIPKTSRFIRFFQMWRQIARYNMAKDRIKG
ncbi:MAG: hypothetical protein A2Z38_00375 [Planctomycetes bacterium RBG_19FT_COMBO_48_8]|nr:MAG: hypothetical protein A2Z38_00375 [Planctomycetes bacterium RBG_19FT_COMBO_48_8]